MYRNRWPRVSPLAVQLIAYMAIAIVAVTVAVSVSRVALESSDKSGHEAKAALLVSQIEANAVRLQQLVTDAERPEVQQITFAWVLEGDRLLQDSETKAEEALLLVGSAETLQIWGVAGEARTAFADYIENPGTALAQVLELRLLSMESLVAQAQPHLATIAGAHQSTFERAVTWALATNIVIAGLAFVIVTTSSVWIGRRSRSALIEAEAERATLAETTGGLNRKNEQLAALYQIITEVSDSLSLKYVVETTIRQAKTLVGAELVVLRLLQGDRLAVAGVAHDGEAAPELAEVPLGTGVTGRVAKRGKPFKIDSGAQESLADAEHVEFLESGLVVPLIVGARVVGTIGCWSKDPSHFSDDDQRILEMMASQVATAVVSAELHEDSQQQAHHDPLTGMPNRRQLAEDAEGYLKTLIEQARPFSVAMVDIDNFKRFNDDYGHRIGDVALQKVAQVLQTSLRDVDRVYRYGGEEFTVVFVDAASEDAESMAERLRKAIERMPLTGENVEPIGPLTISLGLASFPDQSTNFEDLVRMSDIALYQAKAKGRNQVVFATPDTDSDSAAA